MTRRKRQPLPIGDDAVEQLREVYAAYGVAAYQAQCVERQLAILLATRYGPDIQRNLREQQDELLETLFQQTLGGLIVTLRESVHVPKSVEARLRDAQAKRNWLVHNYYWERVGHLLSDSGRRSMAQELHTMAEEFKELHQHLIRIARNWAEEHGITDEDLYAEIEALTQSAQGDENLADEA